MIERLLLSDQLTLPKFPLSDNTGFITFGTQGVAASGIGLTSIMADDFPDLDELQAGDEAAWTKAFRALWPVALRAARHPATALSAEDAEEAASDALACLVPLAKRVSSVHELKALV